MIDTFLFGVDGEVYAKKHQWDEEFRNYDTDEDVFDEIRMDHNI